jgi:hypothetical protein
MTQTAPPEVKKPTDTVTVTFNGVDREIIYNPLAPVQVILNHAKERFGVQSNHLLSLFTENGAELPDGESAASAGIVSGALLILRQSTVRGGHQ